MRRIITVTLLLAIVGATAWWLWHWQEGPEKAADPWAVVTNDAVAVLEVPEPFRAWDRFTGTSQFWGDLEGKPAYAALDTLIKRMARPQTGTRPGKDGFGPLLITWRMDGDNRPVPVVAMAMARSGEATAMLADALGIKAQSVAEAGGLVAARPDTALPELKLAWEAGLLLVGPDDVAVNALRAAAKKTAPPEALFTKARASLSIGADAHLLVRTGLASRFLSLTDQELFAHGADFRGWMAMDLRFRPGAVLINGLLFTDDGGNTARAMAHQQPGKPELIRVLPATVTRLQAIQVDDPAALVRDLNGAGPDEGLFQAYGAWVKGSVGVAGEGGEEGQRWAVLGAGDPEQAVQAMRMRCPDGGCPVTEYRGIPVTRLADPEALVTLYGKDFAQIEQPLWALLGDMVVFSGTPAGMRAAIDAWTDRNAMAFDPRTGDYFDRFASEAVYSWWADVPRTYPVNEGPLADARRTMGAALLQLTPRGDGAFMATFCLQHATTGKQTDGALWTAALPAPLGAPPMLVKDYLSKTLQVFVQDRDERISLISCTGKILWQRQVDGPIIGGVQQIDRYRNGKLQLLFNTANKVYLIDRLGRDVEGFPVDLKGAASAPLSVFDYEGKKDYRIVVPVANGRLLNLGPDGKPVKGWEPAVLSGPAVAPVEHVRLKGKDFLVVVQRNGKVAVLDRRGALRYTPELQLHRMQDFLGSREAMEIADRRLIWLDSTGAVLAGKLSGEVDTLAHATGGKATLFRAGAAKEDAVLRTTASGLWAEQRGKVLFRNSFPDSPGALAFPIPAQSGGETIGLVQPETGQLRMFNAAGDLLPGFPLKGAVRFEVADINLDGLLELVTADREGVVTVYPLPLAP